MGPGDLAMVDLPLGRRTQTSPELQVQLWPRAFFCGDRAAGMDCVWSNAAARSAAPPRAERWRPVNPRFVRLWDFDFCRVVGVGLASTAVCDGGYCRPDAP